MNVPDSDDFWQNVAFPLPYRIFLLVGLGILAWAANLHGLDLLGIDAVSALDLRVDDSNGPRLPTTHRPLVHSSAGFVIKSTYNVFLAYSSYCLVSWLFYRLGTKGDPALVDAYGHIPVLHTIILVLIILCPYDVLFRAERDKFVQAIRRCLFSSMNTPILFSDVVFADIGTSFAKVFGDTWLALCMLLPGNTMLSPPSYDGLARWFLPTVMSVPYFVRFRQCIIEYNLPSNESKRPFFNAIKYATAFPVIFLSAAQHLVVVDLVNEKGIQVTREPWHGEHHLFRLWLLAVFINSVYSFWWDISNDWGLELLRTEASIMKEKMASRPRLLPEMRSTTTTPLIGRRSLGSPTQSTFPEPLSSAHSRSASQPIALSPSPPNSHASHKRQDYPYGLRPILLFPTFVYPALILCNFVLRMSWSVRLSSHLHSARDGSIAVFWLEVAEIVRRWLWVYLRVEWEVVKKMMHPSEPSAFATNHGVLFEQEGSWTTQGNEPDSLAIGSGLANLGLGIGHGKGGGSGLLTPDDPESFEVISNVGSLGYQSDHLR